MQPQEIAEMAIAIAKNMQQQPEPAKPENLQKYLEIEQMKVTQLLRIADYSEQIAKHLSKVAIVFEDESFVLHIQKLLFPVIKPETKCEKPKKPAQKKTKQKAKSKKRKTSP